VARKAPDHEFGSTTQRELHEAIVVCAEAERRSAESRAEYYTRVMRSYAAHHPEVPPHKVGAASRKELNYYMWSRWGKPHGEPRSAYEVAPAWWRAVASTLGYTDKSMSSVKEGDTNVAFYKSREHERVERACAMMAEAVARCRDTCARVPDIGGEALETFVADAEALRDNARDLSNPGVDVPVNAQGLLISLMAAASGVDRLMRTFGVELKELKWAAERRRGRPPVTRKELSNISSSRTARVPEAREPKSSLAAQWRKFTGARCRCGCWRVRASGDAQRCLRCSREFPAAEPMRCPNCLYDLARVPGERDPCPNCGGPTRLPASMR